MPTWFRLDDDFYLNPKVQACEPGDILLWITAIAWSHGRETDGRVPLRMLVKLAALVGVANPDAAVERLVAEGLIDPPDPDGTPEHRVHDYLAKQWSADQIRAQAEAAAERQARAREKRKAAAEQREMTQDADKSRRDSPVTSRVSDAVSHTATHTQTHTQTQTNDSSRSRARTRADGPRGPLARLLNRVAWEQAKATPGVRNVGALRQSIVVGAADDGLLDELRRLLDRHPDADIDWLVDEHLRRPHRLPSTTPEIELARLRAANGATP